jgi:SAM-dependent methyltransferase
MGCDDLPMTDDEALYDRIGVGYSTARSADPRLGAAIAAALGDAETVVNVGAGTGAYEPPGCTVIAVEPSEVMIAQRSAGEARVIRANAERIPLADNSVDAAMAVFSDHHWNDRLRGLREMQRVARSTVVLVNSDPGRADDFWLTRGYLRAFHRLIPEPYRRPGYWERELADLWGRIEVRVLPVPYDCRDGFYQAYWRRPSAYLSPELRDRISAFRLLSRHEVDEAVGRLADDLETGRWLDRHQELMTKDEADVGLRVVVGHL